ncbi:hypothetical protein C0993_011339, partial [Termitomyces sp. T159_Od127]
MSMAPGGGGASLVLLFFAPFFLLAAPGIATGKGALFLALPARPHVAGEGVAAAADTDKLCRIVVVLAGHVAVGVVLAAGKVLGAVQALVAGLAAVLEGRDTHLLGLFQQRFTIREETLLWKAPRAAFSA